MSKSQTTQVQIDIQQGEDGWWFVTSPKPHGIMVTAPTLGEALAGVPKALSDLDAAAISETTKPCPFCGSDLRHLERLVSPFNKPPRVCREIHHPDVPCFFGFQVSFGDDPMERLRWIGRWNWRTES